MCRPAKEIKVESCIKILDECFDKFTDPRSSFEIRLKDFLLSSFAVFNLKYPSLFSFQDDYDKGIISKSCHGLFGIENLPSDTHLRDIMDEVDPKDFRRVFKKLFAFTQRNKMLEGYEFLRLGVTPYYLVAGDGTGYFSSHKVRCDGCSIYE